MQADATADSDSDAGADLDTHARANGHTHASADGNVRPLLSHSPKHEWAHH